MSIDFPSSAIISNVKITHDTPNFFNTAINRESTAYERGIHQLKGSFDVTLYTEEVQRDFESFLLNVRGRANPFYLDLGKRFHSNYNDISLVRAHTQGENKLYFNVGTPPLPTGTYFNIQNDDKVYMFIQPLYHAQPATIYPALRKAQPQDARLSFRNVKILVNLISDIQEIDYEESGLIHTYTLNWEEKLR